MRVSVRAGSHRIARSLLSVGAISAITLAASPVPSQWALSSSCAVRPALSNPSVAEASS
jgi:hypothetical protein